MENVRKLTVNIIFVVLTAIGLTVGLLSAWWIGLVVFAGLIALFLITSIRPVPANPPNKAILLLWGERKDVIVDEGLRFFPGYPLVFNGVLIKVVKVNQDFPEQKVRTPDNAEVSITASITWTPRYKDAELPPSEFPKRNAPILLKNYLNSGAEAGVKNILEDIFKDRLRRWASSADEGPATWMEAIKASDAALAVIAKTIIGDKWHKIGVEGFDVPTADLLAFFSSPRPKPTATQRVSWGQGRGGWNWKKLEDKINALPPEKRADIEGQIKKRKEAIEAIRRGNGNFVKEELGIEINRITINEIKPLGEVAIAGEKEAKEERERAAEILEIGHIVDRAKEIKKKLEVSGETAIELLQSERPSEKESKVKKTISQTNVKISDETMRVLKDIVSLFKKSP